MKLEERVLKFVNRIRAKQKLKPLKKLPRGIPLDTDACPIARAVGGIANARTVEWCDGTARVSTPFFVREFMYQFDTGQIPELVAK